MFDFFQLLLVLGLELTLAFGKSFEFLEQQGVNLDLAIKTKLYRPIVVRANDIKSQWGYILLFLLSFFVGWSPVSRVEYGHYDARCGSSFAFSLCLGISKGILGLILRICCGRISRAGRVGRNFWFFKDDFLLVSCLRIVVICDGNFYLVLASRVFLKALGVD